MNTWTWIIAGFVTLDTAALAAAAALLAAIARTPLLAMSALTSVILPKTAKVEPHGMSLSALLGAAESLGVPED